MRTLPSNLSVLRVVPLQPLTNDSEPISVLWSDPAADQILHSNIWSYPHYSKSTLLPPSTLLLFKPWLPNTGTRGHCM